jgi:hypothetical protein
MLYQRKKFLKIKTTEETSDSKNAIYFIGRFRQLSSSTSNWGLLFFSAIFFSWAISIFPQEDFISNYVTNINKVKHFNNLIKDASKNKIDSVRRLEDSLKIYELKSKKNGISIKYKTQLQDQIAFIKKRLAKLNLDRKKRYELKTLLEKTTAQKGYVKDSMRRVIKDNFFAGDIIITRAEIEKQEVAKYKDSIYNKTKVLFNVPGISPIDLGFGKGLLFCMILIIVLLFYLYNARQKLISYLRKICQYNQGNVNFASDLDQNDLQTPLWFAPIIISRGPEKSKYVNLIGWRNTKLNNIVLIALTALIFGMQLHVFWISWTLNSNPYFDETLKFKVYSLILMAVTIFIIFLWLQPVSLNSDFNKSDHYAFKRREIIKAIASSFVLLFLIPYFGKAIPKPQGNDTGFIRKRKKKRYAKSKLPDGFYVNIIHDKKKLHRHDNMIGDKIILHHYHNGYSASFKFLKLDQVEAFEKKLKPVDFMKYVNEGDINNVHIPHWQFLFEREALWQIEKQKYADALKILLYGLLYVLSKSITEKTVLSIMRMYNLYRGLYKRFSGKLSQSDKIAVDDYHKAIAGDIKFLFERYKALYLKSNEKIKGTDWQKFEHFNYKKHWQNAESLPWKCPTLYFKKNVMPERA